MPENPADSPYDFVPADRPASVEASSAPGTPGAPAAPGRPAVTSAPAAGSLPEQFCPHCGFRIVGKARRGRCPDCSAPLGAAPSDLLQFSAASWVRALSNGAALVALALGGHVAAVIVGWTGRWTPGAITHLSAAAVGLLGVLLATRGEPDPAAPRYAAALYVRLVALFILAAWVLALLVILQHLGGYRRPVIVLALVGYLAESLLFGFYLQKIAVRIPSDTLASHLQNLSWIVAVMCLVIILLHAFSVADPAHLVLFFCAFPMIGGFVAVTLWAIVTLIRFAVETRQSAVAGETIAIRKAERALKKK